MKTKLISFYMFFVFFVFFNINAQIGFESHSIIDDVDAIPSPKYIKSVDINGDGNLDVLIATDYKIGWYENTNFENEFKPIQIIEKTRSIQVINFGDIDADGDIDIVASVDSFYIVWYENTDGKGSFSSRKTISQSSPHELFLVDIDGDKDLDILSNSSSIEWYVNIDGLGNFSIANVIDSQSNFNSPLFPADIDGDKDIDIIFSTKSVTRETDKIAWLENLDGKGTFGSEKLIAYDNQGIESIYASDLDGDNDIDILLGSRFDKSISWFENSNGLGVFNAKTPINQNIKDISIFQVNDVDSDGDNDLVFADISLGIIAWHENLDGLGNFGSERPIFNYNQSFSNHNGPKFIYSSDLDDDGDMDIISVTRLFNVGEVNWYKNDGSEMFEKQHPISENLRYVQCAYSGDINGDGFIDVVSGTYDLSWFKSIDEKGNFHSKKIIDKSIIDQPLSNGVYSLLLKDIDNDNDLDIICSINLNEIVWYENTDGLGTFSNSKTIASSLDKLTSIYVIDIDNDDDLDVISATSGDNKIVWYENLDGKGTFSQQKIINNNAPYINSIYAIDLDNDKYVDVLSASNSFNENKISWYKNLDGKGSFSNEKIITTNFHPNSIKAADIDGDNYIDVFSTSDINDKIAWFKNLDGLGSFSSEKIVSNLDDNPNIILSLDLDKDGDLDLVSGSKASNKISWHENTDGIGNFGEQQIISTNLKDLQTIEATDINKDGILDLLSASGIKGDINGDYKIEWHENLGTKLTINENKLIKKFQAFPNPTNRILHIKSKYKISEYEVYNSIGQIVLSDYYKVSIDVSLLRNGIYFIKIKDIFGNSETKKIIKN